MTEKGEGLPTGGPNNNLRELADQHCRRCYGTGRIGFRTVNGKQTAIPCKCVKKAIFERIVKAHRERKNNESGTDNGTNDDGV